MPLSQKTTQKRRVTVQIEDGNIVEFRLDDAVLRALNKRAAATSPPHNQPAAIGSIVNSALIHYLFEEMFPSDILK